MLQMLIGLKKGKIINYLFVVLKNLRTFVLPRSVTVAD